MQQDDGKHPAIPTSSDDETSTAAERLVAGLSWDGPSLLDRAPVEMVYEEEEGIQLRVEISASTKDDRKHALEALASVVGARDAELLLKSERDVINWLRASPDHPTTFLADPLACLKMLDIALSEDAWQRLVKHRAASVRSSEPSAFSALKSLTISTSQRAPK